MDKCPIHNPERRVQLLVAFEILRAILVLAIIGWWGWLLIDKTYQIANLQGTIDAHAVKRMIFWEAITLFLLVLLSTVFSLWYYLRDIRRTRELKSFFAAMAHELRTPLTSIRLQAESLATKIKSPITSRLIADTARLEAQVERGLELARVESGKALHLTDVDLKESWRRALALFSTSEQKRLKLTVGKFVKIRAEEQCVQVIFRNLIENTLRHAGTKVVGVFIHAEVEDDVVKFIFRDNGTGFKGDAQKLGQLFYKGALSNGTGLGLYLIRMLMKAQGGGARFHTNDGFGVTLEFRKSHA